MKDVLYFTRKVSGMDLSGKYALVTGASSGIGWQLSDQLAGQGCNIIAVSNQPSRLADLKDELERSHAVRVLTLEQDLAREEAAEKVFEFCDIKKLCVEILVNNAGMFFFSEMVEADYGSAKSLLLLHMTTPALLCRLFGEKMKARGSGYILNVSSISAVMPYPTISMYGPTKAFLRHFTRAIRTEMKPYGIRVTCMLPGATVTSLYERYPTVNSMVRKLGGAARPEKVAKAGLRALFRNRPVVVSRSHEQGGHMPVSPDSPFIDRVVVPALFCKEKVMERAYKKRKLGNSDLWLKNAFIRSAAYEGMQEQGIPTSALTEHHVSMARGGVAMTTVSYGAVSAGGRTFKDQMYLNREALDS